MDFTKFFQNLGSTPLQQSSFGGDTPTFSLFKESLDDGAGEGFFNLGESPVSELNPAENSAQTWKRHAETYLDPKNQSTGSFVHLHNALFGNTSFEQPDGKVGQNTTFTPADTDFSPAANMARAQNSQFASLQSTPPIADMSSPTNYISSSPNNARNRFALKDKLGLTGNQYLQAFNRIDARAPMAKNNNLYAY